MSAHGGGVPFGDAARNATAPPYIGKRRAVTQAIEDALADPEILTEVGWLMTHPPGAEFPWARHRPEPLDDEAGWEPEYVPPCEDYDADHREAPDG